MPINPQIYVPQIQPMQLQDPMVFARNALAMDEAEASIAANQLKVKRANQLAGLIKGGTKPLTPQDLLSAGLFEEAESLAKAENALTAGQKSSLDVVGAAMDTSARLLDTVRTPQEMMAWHEANHADPVLGKYLAARGITAEQSRAKIAEAAKDPVAFQQLILDARLGLKDSRKQHFIEQNYGGGTRVLAMGEYGGPARAVEGSDIKVTASPNRPLINLAESKRTGTLGEAGAKAEVDEYNLAKQAARGINKDYETIKLLKEGKPSTGITAELELGFNRLKAATGGKPEAIEKVADTEYLEALLGSDVFKQIQDLGVGARGLDTVNERKFLQEVVSGTRSLDKETLIQMAEYRAKYKRQLVDEYNSRVESGELDDFFRDYGRKKQPFKLPPPPEVTVTAPGGRPLGQAGITVQVPGVGAVTFPNKEAADNFKKAAGIK